jgi:hypothetical protein
MIRTENIPDTILECHPYANPLSPLVLLGSEVLSPDIFLHKMPCIFLIFCMRDVYPKHDQKSTNYMAVFWVVIHLVLCVITKSDENIWV